MKERKALTGTLLYALLAGTPLTAGVEVIPEAAHTGSFGLRATVEPACDGEDTVLVLGPVVTPQVVEACKEVVVGAEVQEGGELVSLAGKRVAFTHGFSVGPGGRLVAGTTGDWNPSYVVDETPQDESELHVQWWARFDETDLPAGEEMTILRVRVGGLERGWVRYQASLDGGAAWVEVLGDDGELRNSGEVTLGPGWHRLELGWIAGAVLEPTGSMELRVDDGEPRGVSGVPLGSAVVEAIEVGVLGAKGSGGWVDLDDYATARLGPSGSGGEASEGSD